MTAFDEIEPLITAHPFTPEQKEAITSQGNVIVSAGAGSGKTSVMIARIINKLLLGAKLGEMLIVTFTRASAADMRVKLSQKLIAVKQGARDKNVRALASAALDDLSVCNIGTLHSYCQRLIKQYFFVAGLDPSATVCEDGEAKLIRQAAAKSAVRAALDGGDGVFCELYDMLCSRRSDDGAVQTVCDIMEFALSMPDPTAYLGGVRPDSEYAPELERILSARRADILDRAQRLKGELLRVKLQKAASVTDEFADYLDGKISELTRTSIAPKDDGQAEAKELFAAVKSDCEKLKKDIVAAKAAEKVDGEPYARRLCEVALDGCCRYASRKAALGKIDYSDFEHGAFRVLSDGVCMSEIVSSVKYVFVDEFQDVNPLQSAITDLFKAAGAEMFVVGDIKQSIYGFRRCSPEHFARAVERAQTMHDYRHISLAKNFRSSAPVIDFVNRVFCPIMKRDFGGVDYDTPEQKLVCGANIADGGASYVLLPAAEKSRASGEISPEPYSVKASAVGKAEHDPEAVFIADYIVDWLDKQNERARAQLKNGDPHVKMPALSDIAVLTRTSDPAFNAALAAEFDARAIKYAFGKKSSVKTYPEAVALVDTARAVVNRYDDVAVYTALRFGLGGFSDVEIAELADAGDSACRRKRVPLLYGAKEYALYQKLTEYRGALYTRVKRFIERLDGLYAFSANHDAADVLGEITARTDYFGYVYGSGGQAQAVQTLIDYAADKKCDICAFIKYYDSADFELEVNASGDAVAVCTEHSSKGLEYGLVIVASVAHRFNFRDLSKKAIVCEKGVFLHVPTAAKVTVPSVPYLLEKLVAPDRQREEQLRLFYVALTRAKQTLVVCGKDVRSDCASPLAAVSQLDFMRHIPPSRPELVCRAGEGDAVTALPEDLSVAAAVRARIDRANAYVKSELPIKTCVTAIAATADDYTSAAPVIVSDKKYESDDGVDVMLRGTAYHAAMEAVDFARPDTERLKNTCPNFDLVRPDEITAAAAAMQKLTSGAIAVMRERPFIMPVCAEELGCEGDGRALVQGVIDLLAVYPDGTAVIVDYKTGDPNKLINPEYALQLKLYAEAVERCTPYAVSHAYLYSFAAGTLLECDIRSRAGVNRKFS